MLTFENALCLSFFMGLFFFIVAYFSPRSYDNKGCYLFLKAKVIKLLLPALFYFFILNPLCIFLVTPRPYTSSLGFYNMWFIMALFYFSVFYATFRRWFRGLQQQIPFPNGLGLLGFIGVQAPIIVSLQLALRPVDIPIMLKVGIIFTGVLFLSYIVSHWLLKNRVIKQII